MEPNETDNPDSPALAAIIEAGERLLAALKAERLLSKARPRDFAEVPEYLESVSYARKDVDERAKEYYTILAEHGFPDIPIRNEIETGENRLRWNWPPLRS